MTFLMTLNALAGFVLAAAMFGFIAGSYVMYRACRKVWR